MSRMKSIRHVVAFLFIAGAAPLWARSPAATCVSQAPKNWNFDTQGCKTGGMKTYLSPGSAFYFQIRRRSLREIPGLHKAPYRKQGAGKRNSRCCIRASLAGGSLWVRVLFLKALQLLITITIVLKERGIGDSTLPYVSSKVFRGPNPVSDTCKGVGGFWPE